MNAGSLALLVALVVVAVGASITTTRAAEPRPIVVTRDDDSIRAACRPASIARKLNAFVRSYNRGERRVDRYVDFSTHGVDTSRGSFSIGDALGFQRAGRAASFRRLAHKRHARGERLTLLLLRTAPVRGFTGLSSIGFQLERTATDETAGQTWVDGKGAMYCTSGRLYLFASKVLEPERPFSDLGCPAPPKGTPAKATIACVASYRVRNVDREHSTSFTSIKMWATVLTWRRHWGMNGPGKSRE